MAGGTFNSQNKIRPGAYINFKSIAKASANLGSRGIVTMPLSLDWGEKEKIISVNTTDFIEGKCIDTIGYYGNEKGAQAIREALKNSSTLLIYRLDTGGTIATATQDNLTVKARYEGSLGNRLSITIKDMGNSKFKVSTLLDSRVVDEQIGATIEDLKENSFVTFLGTGALKAIAGKTLESGGNGTVATTNYTTYLNLIKPKIFNTMGVYTTDNTVKQSITTFIKDLRDNKGKKVQAVLNDYTAANYEGIISVKQGYKTDNEEVKVDGFVAYVAGLTAGANMNKSNTYDVINGANYIIDPMSEDDIEAAVIAGNLVLSYRQDEKVIVETDINTLTTYASDKGPEFSKNRIIRTLDELNNSIKLAWETKYIGKVDNNELGRDLFKSEIISLMNAAQGIGAITDFKSEDVSIVQGNSKDSVVCELGITPVDAMEKLYLTVNVG